MQISISARHGQLGDPTRAKITAKLEKLLRLFDRLTTIEVTVDLEHQESPEVEVRVSAEHKHDFTARERADSLMAAVDVAAHKIEQQLRKYKEKVQERHRGPGLGKQAAGDVRPAGEARPAGGEQRDA